MPTSDEIGRPTASADYGTNGGAAFTRPDSAPASSDTVLVSTIEYNSSGEAYKTIDPAGREDRTQLDDAGRTTKTIQNYTDGDPSSGGSDEDVTVETTYNADNKILTLTAKNSTTGDQVTNYVYGTSMGGITPIIWRNDLLRAEIYPDSDDTTALGDGPDGIYDRVEYKYNRQGERIWKKDQNGTVHEYEFDTLGRDMADKVTTVGTGVDDAVLRIAKSYEVRGMVDTITSHSTVGPALPAGSSSSSSSSGASDVVNQVTFEYTDAALLDKEYQEHSGAKDGSTPYVGYNYDTTTSAGEFTKGLRPTSLRYPDGRLVHNTYATDGSTADALNRIAAIKDDSGGSPGPSLAEYSYLGADSIVQVDYPEPDLRYDLAHGGGDDPYDGMDRFGRVVDLLWRDYGSSADAVRIQHGYDRAGSRTYREDPVAAAASAHLDELYGYDGVNRLTDLDRGNLNANKDALVAASMNFAQEWSLDPTGNWSTFKQDDDGDATWDLNQSRTHDKVNELTQIAGSSTHVAHDKSGNTTKIPKPAVWNDHYDLTYDAWNRLVKVVDGANTVAEYEYDGAKRRVIKKSYTAGVLDETRHYYYTQPKKWQVIEERVDASTNPDRQFIWGLRYVDDLILRDRDTSDPKNGTLDERLYALQDPNWNVVALADITGAIQERYAYTAYGTPSVLTPSFTTRAGSSYAWEVLYAGYRYDSDTAQYQVRHRVLDPRLGWLQRDPLEVLRGGNLYDYVAGRPTTSLDPTGEQFIDCADPQPEWLCEDGPKFCGWLTWLAGNCCSAADIAKAKSNCASQSQELCSCSKWPGKGPGFMFNCKEKKKGKKRPPWRCTHKPRGNCPPGCQAPFPGYGSTKNEAKAISFAACVKAGCHTPGGSPYSCNCGHPTCHKQPN